MNSDTLRRYRCKYEYTFRYGDVVHTWSVVGVKGVVHLHITASTDRSPAHGGIEIHYRQPPDCMKDQPPTHDNCWLLNQPCWHDGSSLQVEETWIPLWNNLGDDHDAMLERLASYADGQFEEENQ